MLRWDCDKKREVERREVDAFLDELAAVCRKHRLSLAHEDVQGAFEVHPLNEKNIEWVQAAHISGISDTPGAVNG